jgi:hydrogenase-4 component B
MITVVLLGAAAFLFFALFPLVIGNQRHGSTVTYGLCCAVSLVLLVAAAAHLLGRTPNTMALPLGLPWLGAHFRLDALSAFFLCLRWAMVPAKVHPCGCCLSIPHSSAP